MESGSYSVESKSGLRLLRSGERCIDEPAPDPGGPRLCFAVADHRAGALEVRAWGERVIFVVRPKGRVTGTDSAGLVLDDGGERVSVRWSFSGDVRLPLLTGRRVRVEHRVEMLGAVAVSESLVVIDELDGSVLLVAHEGSLDRAPAAFAVELSGDSVRARSPQQRRTHEITVLAIAGRRHVAFVASPRPL